MASGSSLLQRAVRRVNRDLNWVSQRLFNPAPMVPAEALEGAGFRAVFPAEHYDMPRPDGLDDADWTIFQSAMKPVIPAGRLIDLAGGHLVSEDSWVFTAKGTAVLGLWDQQGRMSERQRIYSAGQVTPERLAAARHLPGTTVVLNQLVGANFYHFMNQCVTRLAIVEKIIDFADVDHFVTPTRTTGFMRQLLAHCGIDDTKIVPMEADVLRCERLIATSNPGPHHVPPTWANDYLRRIMPVAAAPTPSSRIFISRLDAPKRELLNHDAVMALLERYGFEHATLSGRSVAEQAALFREADVIVAVHGAALANLVFSPPGQKVIELLPNNHLQPCFWTVGKIGGLDYMILRSTEKPLPVAKWRLDVDADLTIDTDALEALLIAATGKA
ncbi:MAG: glycosyltransferase family 61 protein [Hyphomonas sp.]